MRYVPNLISEKNKVLPDYFKGGIYSPKKKKTLASIILWAMGIFFLLGAFVSLIHPILAIIWGLIGFILIPPGHKFVERKLRFRFTSRIRAITLAILFISAVPLTNHYVQQEQQIANEKKLADEKDQTRKDSFNYYVQKGKESVKAHNLEEANKQLNKASSFAALSIDSEQIEKIKTEIASVKIFDLVKAGKYQAALPELDKLLNSDPSNETLIYNRAICYSKTGKTQEAVEDLKPLIKSGNVEANKLHDKINPIRRRVAYYVTRCCDGSTSYATGRGACSHHGGVCNWNDPVYEEYRKYE